MPSSDVDVTEKFATSASNHSDDDSLTYEQIREEIRIANPQGVTSVQNGIDVEKAEQDFEDLNREFSHISHQARHVSKQTSRVSKGGHTVEDVEKTASSQNSDEWDLETTLRGNRAAEEEAGIRNKHIGLLSPLQGVIRQ